MTTNRFVAVLFIEDALLLAGAILGGVWAFAALVSVVYVMFPACILFLSNVVGGGS